MDAQNHGSFAVHYAITMYTDEAVMVRTLGMGASGGASLQYSRTFHTQPRHLPSQTITYCPIYLAAIRGLNEVVMFLLESGISPDGGKIAGSNVTPLFGALLAGTESTALALIQAGASLESATLGQNALHAASRAGLRKIADYLVRVKGMDIDAKSSSGATPIALAMSGGKTLMVEHLLQMGAKGHDPLLQACYEHEFTFALQLLDSFSPVMENSPDRQQIVHLVVLVASAKVKYARHAQRALVHRLLVALNTFPVPRHSQTTQTAMSSCHADEQLCVFLQTMLSIDHGEPSMAKLLMHNGVRIMPATFIDVLGALRSSAFKHSKIRLMREHPKLLKIFHLLHSHCLSMREEERDWIVGYFLRQVPGEAARLVQVMLERDISLTARGLETMNRLSGSR